MSLRDYSGDSQTIGQFSAKSDAQQALYDIVQALLNYNDDAVCATPKKKACSRVKCFFAALLKAFLYLLAAILVIYAFLHIPVPTSTKTQAPAVVSAPVSEDAASVAPAASSDLSEIPEGEAVDADSILAPETSSDNATQTE